MNDDEDSDLSCPICLEQYDLASREPRMLLCKGSHEVCTDCIRQLPTRDGDQLECPMCKELVLARSNPNRSLVAALKKSDRRNHVMHDTPAAASPAGEASKAAKRRRWKAPSKKSKDKMRGRHMPEHLLGGLFAALVVVTAGGAVTIAHVRSLPSDMDATHGTCIEIAPAARDAGRDDIQIRVASDPLPVDTGQEELEKQVLREHRGWRRPQGLKGYSVDADYPDLYAYFDAADRSSPHNELITDAFSAYPQDGMPRGGIRGPAVVVRAEPPVSSARTAMSQGAGHWIEDFEQQHHPVSKRGHEVEFSLNISIAQMLDVLEYYQEFDAGDVASHRDRQRLLSQVPAEHRVRMGDSSYSGQASVPKRKSKLK